MDKKNILVVDDSLINRKTLSAMFSEKFNVLEAADGDKGIDLLREYPNEISAVLLDIIMPKKDGYEVLSIMKHDDKLKDIPVIVITASSDNESELKAINMGADDFVVKPFDSNIVAKRVNNIIGKKEYEKAKIDNILLHEEILQNKKQLSLLDNIPGGIAIISYGTRIVVEVGNDSVYKMFGYDTPEDRNYFSKNIKTFVDQEDYENVIPTFREAKITLKNFSQSIRILKKDGTYLWVMLNVQPIRCEKKTKFFTLITDISKEKQLIRELKYNSEYDALTNIYKKETFEKATQEMLKMHSYQDYVLLVWNVERFKILNDLLGTITGDRILQSIATFFRENFLNSGTFGRLNADRFALCIPEINLDVEDILKGLNERFSWINHNVVIKCGVYKIDDINLEVNQMCDRANLALQTIKGKYLEKFAFYDDRLRNILLEEQSLIDDSEKALKEKQFKIFLQPIFSLVTKTPISAEVLVRWIHPEQGVISPGLFIPLFERNGFISKLDFYVWEQTCIFLKSRREKGYCDVPVSVNVSRMSLYDATLFEKIVALTEKYDIPPYLFKIEITESAYTDNPKQLLETVAKLRDKGFIVLMDDFGSGYSSLNTLKDISVDVLKIDMKFLENFENSNKTGCILQSIVKMAKRLGMSVIAEGVETSNQLDFLKSIGCDRIQGFYFARPMPCEEFETYIQNYKMQKDIRSNTSITETELEVVFNGNPSVDRILNNMFSGIGFYEYSNGKIEVLRVNDAFYDITGIEPSELVQSVNMNSIPVADRKLIFDAYRQIEKDQKPVSVQYRRIGKNGDITWFEAQHRFIGSHDEKTILLVAFNNITNQKQLENANELNRYVEILYKFFDEIFEIDYKKSSLIARKIYRDSVNIGIVQDFSHNFVEWLNKHVHKDDKEKLVDFLSKNNDDDYRKKEDRNTQYIQYRICLDDGTVKMIETSLIYFDFNTCLICNVDLEKKR